MKFETEINPQNAFIESLDGIYLIDAGAGTGKTHTIVRRYQKLIEKDIHPKDILLITFTRNAANQMREDVITSVAGNFAITDFLEAPILNFHALCSKILKNYGTDSPKHIGIDEILSKNFSIIEDSYYETEFFGKFFTYFKKQTENKYKSIYLSLNDDYKTVLLIIKKLCSRGIFPMKSGWFNDGETLLKGNYEEYSNIFEELNKTVWHKTKKNFENQNKLYKILKSASEKNVYIDFNFEEKVLRSKANPEIKINLFNDESQLEVIGFVRHIYHFYIEYMLKKNLLNFDFMVMLAFLVLYNDEKIRENNQFQYVMVDEFQDTDEIQFQLLMLLIKNINGSLSKFYFSK